MRPWWIGILWFVAAAGILIGSAILGEPTPASYWFFLGAALFFFGVSHIIRAIERSKK